MQLAPFYLLLDCSCSFRRDHATSTTAVFYQTMRTYQVAKINASSSDADELAPREALLEVHLQGHPQRQAIPSRHALHRRPHDLLQVGRASGLDLEDELVVDL